MTYIFHGVPLNLEGNTLHPLSILKDSLPDKYEQEVKKYNDHPKRKLLPSKAIPLLNCTRADVLHCSSVDPRLVFKALKTVFPDGNRSVLFYKIPVTSLLDKKLVLFNMNHPKYEFGLDNDPIEAFELINHSKYEGINQVPEEAYAFFQEWKDRGEKGAPAWGKIPHVFVKGSICIDGFEIIDWSK